MKAALDKEVATIKIIALHLGRIKDNDGSEVKVDQVFLIADSVLFDELNIPGGKNMSFLSLKPEVI